MRDTRPPESAPPAASATPTKRCPLCAREHGVAAVPAAYIRVPLDDDGGSEVWFLCDAHMTRWREDYHREGWTPDLLGEGEREPHEEGWSLGRLHEHRAQQLRAYRVVEPYASNRHLVEIPDTFAVASWSRHADVATICRCILGTLKYEPHSGDVTALRHALEGVIERGRKEGAA